MPLVAPHPPQHFRFFPLHHHHVHPKNPPNFIALDYVDPQMIVPKNFQFCFRIMISTRLLLPPGLFHDILLHHRDMILIARMSFALVLLHHHLSCRPPAHSLFCVISSCISAPPTPPSNFSGSYHDSPRAALQDALCVVRPGRLCLGLSRLCESLRFLSPRCRFGYAARTSEAFVPALRAPPRASLCRRTAAKSASRGHRTEFAPGECRLQ